MERFEAILKMISVGKTQKARDTSTSGEEAGERRQEPLSGLVSIASLLKGVLLCGGLNRRRKRFGILATSCDEVERPPFGYIVDYTSGEIDGLEGRPGSVLGQLRGWLI